MADEEEIMDGTEESQEDEEEGDKNVPDEDEELKRVPPPDIKSPTPGRQYGVPEIPKTIQRRMANYSGGKPSKHDKDKLMRSEGIIPIQAGSNKYASQRGMTGFGAPRDVIDKVKADNLKEITDAEKIKALKQSTWLQSGTNKFASQKGQTGFGSPRDVNYKTKGTGGASEVPEEKARATDGIVPLQSGTNKLASQAGMTGMGMPRIVDVRKTDEQDRSSQGFIHLQMGTNRFANQSGMTGFGMPRHNITKYKDEQRGEMPNDESAVSRQTTGWREGASQAGMTGFGAFRNNTVANMQAQEQRSQGMIPYQMGVNFLDSQAGKTGFGMPRQVYTPFVDDSHEELPLDMARRPEVPFWSGQETEFANQTGMSAFGTPRDVRGEYAAWCLKLRCLTEEIYVDELENNERGVAEAFLDDSVLASRARLGTSLARPANSVKATSQAVRPMSSSGRPLSGMSRTDNQGRPSTMEQALRTSRTSKTARSVSSSTARFVRLGTASMISQADGPFVNLSRLNIDKYAADPQINQALFEYVFYHEGDMPVAHHIATVATRNADYTDWYWKNQLGKCCYRLGMFNDALKQFHSSLNNQKMVETYGYLAKTYNRIDQPLMAIEQYNLGLQIFRNDITLLTGLARVEEQLGNVEKSVETYKLILQQDPCNIEAIACIATNYFYNDQPEIALRYYRRILQMGVNSGELFMNLGLCCFFCQQFDLAISCIERAQVSASDEIIADVWYNIGNVLLSCGDVKMAARSYRLAMAADANHAESVCNLGVLQMRDGKIDQSRLLFLSAIDKGPYLFEPCYNLALLAYQIGQFDESRTMVLKALELFPEHVYSKTLFGYIEQMYNAL